MPKTHPAERFRTPIAVAVALVMVVSGLAFLTAPPRPIAAATGTLRSTLADQRAQANATIASAMAQAIGKFLRDLPPAALTSADDLNATDIHVLLSHTPYANASPAAVKSALHSLAVFTPLDGSLGDYLARFLTGCALGGASGGLIGSIFPGVGTAFGAAAGCIVGATIEVLWQYYAKGAAGNAETAAESQFNLDETAQLYNDFIYTSGLIQVAESVGNSSLNAFSAMADAVAVNQLPNATFDVLRDMNESGVALQQTTLIDDFMNAVGAGVSTINSAYVNGYGSGGAFASSCSFNLQFTLHTSSPVLGCQSPSSPAFYQVMAAAEEASLTNGTGLEINKGGHAWVACSGGGSNAYLNLAGGGGQYVIPSGTTFLKIAPNFNGVWRLNYPPSGAGSCDAIGQGILAVPPSAGSPTTQIDVTACGLRVTLNASPCDPTNPNLDSVGSFQTAAYGTIQAFINGGAALSGVYTLPHTGSAFFTQENTLMITAELNARTYWAFLHILGYTNVNQIPSNCLIPYPNQILPPQYSPSEGILTLNQSLSLYQAYMNALATFFNTPFNASNFCSGHAPFTVGWTAWNLNTEITGFVYTLPVASQNFGVLSTWTVTNASNSKLRVGNTSSVGSRSAPTPIVIWPTVKTLYAKIGAVQEVPIDAPLNVFVPANGTLYQLTGNGTAAGTHGFSNGTASVSAGAALFISTCQVLNAQGQYVNPTGAYCPLTLSSIANVSFPTTGGGPTPFINGVCSSGVFVYSTVVNEISAFTGSDGLGCLLAQFLAVVVLIVGLIILIAIVVGIVRVVRGLRSRE